MYGPTSSQVVPIRSMDGKTLLRDPTKILDRWRTHFAELLNSPSAVDEDFIQAIPYMPIKESMSASPTPREIESALAN